MRKYYLLCYIVLHAGCMTHNSLQEERQLQSLLDRKEYFKLRTTLEDAGDLISVEKKIYFHAFVSNAFNQNARSIKDVESLLTQYTSDISDSAKVRLLQLQSDNYFKTFQYARSAATDSNLLSQCKDQLDSGQIKDIKNNLLIHRALQNIPPQRVEISQNTNISWARDVIGLIEIPITRGDSSYDAIFDTRANISSITLTYAKKLGLHMLDVSYEEGSGITGIKFQTGLGVADSLYIGKILVRNVVFQVMPDEILYLAPIRFSLNIILGYPLIAQLKEIHIERDNKMSIPLHPAVKGLNNLAMDKLDPVIAVQIGKDTLGFHFDSGASSSDFYSTFYEKYKTKIVKEGRKQKIQSGGAGGVVEVSVYSLDSLSFHTAGKKAILKDIKVHIDPITRDVDEKFYGNLGQDLMMQFKEVILNFDDMYIDFRE